MTQPTYVAFVGVIRVHVGALLAEGDEHEGSSHQQVIVGSLACRVHRNGCSYGAYPNFTNVEQ